MKPPKLKDPAVKSEPSGTLRLHYMTGNDLLESDLIGMWKNRRDIRSSAAFARRLRSRASKRTRPS